MTRYKVTIREFIDAMRKNGYKQVKGSYISLGYQEILGACAYGQAALNLNVDPANLNSAFVRLDIPGQPDILFLNDVQEKTLEEIASVVEKWAKEEKILTHILYVG